MDNLLICFATHKGRQIVEKIEFGFVKKTENEVWVCPVFAQTPKEECDKQAAGLHLVTTTHPSIQFAFERWDGKVASMERRSRKWMDVDGWAVEC